MSALLKVGDTAWWAKNGIREVTRPCPVCFGKRVVRVELGNGELVTTPCDYCGKGYEGPRGIEVECEWVAAVALFTVCGVTIEQSGDKQTARYRTPEGYTLDEIDVFATKEEAEARVLVRIAEHAEEERKRRELAKEYAHKNFAWHVGYHRREAARARKQVEWHEARAVACKERAKTPVEEAP